MKATETGIGAHQWRNHWKLLKRSDTPKRTKPLISFRAFEHKRLHDSALLKHKLRSCAYVDQQNWGVNYQETCSRVANWASVWIFLSLSHVHSLESRSTCFVLAFLRAVLEIYVFMETLQLFDHYCDGKSCFLKLRCTMHGLK